MVIAQGNDQINIIKGDSYEKTIEFTNIDISLIENVFFSCKELNLQKKLDLVNEQYYSLTFSSEETQNFESTSGSYDLTVFFKDKKIKTVIYQSIIKINPKNNMVTDL